MDQTQVNQTDSDSFVGLLNQKKRSISGPNSHIEAFCFVKLRSEVGTNVPKCKGHCVHSPLKTHPSDNEKCTVLTLCCS